jgi:hypothetical protein
MIPKLLIVLRFGSQVIAALYEWAVLAAVILAIAAACSYCSGLLHHG